MNSDVEFMVTLLIGTAVAFAVGAFVTGPLEDRWARRLAGRSRLECSVRVVTGEVQGLSKRWHHGTATLAPRSVHFRRGLPGGRGVRPGSTSVALQVDDVQGERRPTVVEWWTVAPSCVVFLMRSGGVGVELAVKQQQASWVRERLGV